MKIYSLKSDKKILLVRHGQSLCQPKKRLDTGELRQWLIDYDRAGITNLPPDKNLYETANKAKIWSSDLVRSIESAKVLGQKFESDAIFREHDLPVPSLSGLKFSTGTWDVIGKIFWRFGYSPGGESYEAAKLRAQIAAKKLADEAEKYQQVILVGHGAFNFLIGKSLRELGFTPLQGPKFRHWSCREFVQKKKL